MPLSLSPMTKLCRLTFTLLALSSAGLVLGMRTSLSDLDNKMMEDGTFVYGSLSAVQKILLFKDYEATYFREVIFDTAFIDISDLVTKCLNLIDHITSQLSTVRDTKGSSQRFQEFQGNPDAHRRTQRSCEWHCRLRHQPDVRSLSRTIQITILGDYHAKRI